MQTQGQSQQSSHPSSFQSHLPSWFVTAPVVSHLPPLTLSLSRPPHCDLSSTSLYPPCFPGKFRSLSCSNSNPTWLSPERTASPAALSHGSLWTSYWTDLRARRPSGNPFLYFLLLNSLVFFALHQTLILLALLLVISWPPGLLSDDNVSIWVIISVLTTFPLILGNFHIQTDNSNNTLVQWFSDPFHDLLYHHMLAASLGSNI